MAPAGFDILPGRGCFPLSAFTSRGGSATPVDLRDESHRKSGVDLFVYQCGKLLGLEQET